MHDFLKLHHNCDAYMGVQKERKRTFLTAREHREKEARSLFAGQYWYRSCLWMSLSSESTVSQTIPHICSGQQILHFDHPVSIRDDSDFCALCLKRHTNNFAAVEKNSMRFCIRMTHI